LGFWTGCCANEGAPAAVMRNIDTSRLSQLPSFGIGDLTVEFRNGYAATIFYSQFVTTKTEEILADRQSLSNSGKNRSSAVHRELQQVRSGSRVDGALARTF
jgi:hypothetical protein